MNKKQDVEIKTIAAYSNEKLTKSEQRILIEYAKSIKLQLNDEDDVE